MRAFVVFVCIAAAIECALAASCNQYADCESCANDSVCGWFTKTGEGVDRKYRCVQGDAFSCFDSECDQPHLYMHARCPVSLHSVIENRRSVRQYLSTPISTDVIKELIVQANWAPSAVDMEAWRWYVSTNKATIKKVSDYVKAQRGIVQPEDIIFYDAPAVFFLFTKNATEGFEEMDSGLAVQNLMLSAYNMGLATCPIGYSRTGEPIIRQLTGALPYEHYALAVAIGHPAIAATHGRREPFIKYF
eukprot:TRINITY_DN29_c0_g1_i1.p1 TRINITY_DN29_c0_g1~~TRINITY_DN29_c0_g1_i1.p1  ORF type:complete len:247 (-),score=61.28 TRINITY_DN29_c0_g1_i1:331-1071(-)